MRLLTVIHIFFNLNVPSFVWSHLVYINQEEADKLLHPELVLVKILFAQDFGAVAVVCSVSHVYQCSVGSSPSSEVNPPWPGLLPHI